LCLHHWTPLGIHSSRVEATELTYTLCRYILQLHSAIVQIDINQLMTKSNQKYTVSGNAFTTMPNPSYKTTAQTQDTLNTPNFEMFSNLARFHKNATFFRHITQTSTTLILLSQTAKLSHCDEWAVLKVLLTVDGHSNELEYILT